MIGNVLLCVVLTAILIGLEVAKPHITWVVSGWVYAWRARRRKG